MALEGNVAMLIFLGKNYLGQRDKWNVKHSGSGPQGETKADPQVDLNKVLADYLERLR